MSFAPSAPWLNFCGNTPASLSYPSKTIYQLVAETAKQYPDCIAYEFMGKKTSYAALLSRIDRVAGAYVAMGIRKGDRVTICMPNCPQAVDSFYALNRIGAVSNMIHPLSAREEIAFYLKFSHSKAILVLDRFYDKVAAVCPEGVTILVASVKDELPLLLAVTQRRQLPSRQIFTWKKFLSQSAPLPADDGRDTDCACILYSGGTTGTTKGILLSNRNLNALGLQTLAASGFAPIVGMKMLSIMPLFHGFGLGIGIHTALIGGGCCILVPQFSIKTYAKLLAKKRPNIIPGVPTLFEALLRAEKLEKADLSCLKGVFCGGDALSVELKKKVDAFLQAHNANVQIRQGYGLTECVTASCLTPKDSHREGSIGIPFPDTYYKIVKPNTDEALPADTEGEICISGPSVMMGYLDNEAETRSTLRRHGDGRIWLHTGDLGKMDADGFVYFCQRIKRVIITSGYNVYPGQLENILDGHEKVLYSCVIGVKDSYKMQKVKAFVVLRPEFAPTEAVKEELFAYCRERIAKYAMPYDIEFRAELPKTLVGKVAYRKLEEEENG